MGGSVTGMIPYYLPSHTLRASSPMRGKGKGVVGVTLRGVRV